MVEHSGGGWARMVAAWLHNNAAAVIGGKMKLGYGLAQLWDYNENVIDFIEDVGVRNGIMVMGFKTW